MFYLDVHIIFSQQFCCHNSSCYCLLHLHLWLELIKPQATKFTTEALANIIIFFRGSSHLLNVHRVCSTTSLVLDILMGVHYSYQINEFTCACNDAVDKVLKPTLAHKIQISM